MKTLFYKIVRPTCALMLFSSLLLVVQSALGEPMTPATGRTRPIEGQWHFLRADAALNTSTENWQEVSLPHTWNADDGANGGNNYYRGPGWYEKRLELPPEVDGARVFIRFEAASIVSDVYLNGTHLGQHRGAFGAFCFELTDHLRHDGAANELRVRVDNTRVEDVAPLSGDFTVFGGIYRPAGLLILPRTCISPLDYASPGVYVSQHDVSAGSAKVDVRTVLSSSEPTDVSVKVEVTIRDAAGQIVARQSAEAAIHPGVPAEARSAFIIDKPHLWNGRADPYLYSVESVLSGADGKTLDRVAQPLGVRSVSVDPTRGFVLNGQAGKIHGVDRHQDRAGKGWAISEGDCDEDMALMKEMGVTGVRLAHYPHCTYFYSLCDREGVVAWAEIPLVNNIKSTPAFRENIKTQLRELIRQQGNHPAICFWSLFNELYVPPSDADTALVEELHALAKEEDPTRGTVFAGHGETPLKNPAVGTPPELRNITDYIATNRYPGWYFGEPAQMADEITLWNDSGNRRGLGISEYGAGANTKQHEPWPPAKPPKPDGPWHPEEYQTLVHEGTYRAIASSPVTWGSFVWAMFDFASDSRNEGEQPGINDKGLVTRDRKVRKDAFYFYKANWNPEPMVHIADSRYTDRKAGPAAVRVYSNCERVEMFLDGNSLGVQTPDEFKCLLWEGVPLTPGTHRVEAVGLAGERRVSENCEWQTSPE